MRGDSPLSVGAQTQHAKASVGKHRDVRGAALHGLTYHSVLASRISVGFSHGMVAEQQPQLVHNDHAQPLPIVVGLRVVWLPAQGDAG
jgi:hypothetical protein